METELEQEGNDAWRTADIRIRKTQVFFYVVLIFS
jgi:hypothetical protein